MWGYRTCRVAGVRALRALVRPSHPHVGLLFRVWATPPACGTGGPRVKEGVQPNTRLAAMRASLLFRAWAFSSARGPAVPSLGDPAHVRDRRPACGTGGPRAGHVGVQVVVACGQSAFALVADGVVHPIGWHCNPPDWVQCPLTGAVLLALLLRYLLSRCPWAAARPRDRHTRACGSACRLEARPGPAAAPGHRFCPRVPQPSLLLPSEPGGCCGGMRQAAAVFDRCGITK